MKLVKFAAICAAAVSVSAIADDVSNTIAILPVAQTLKVMPLAVNFTDAAGNMLTAENIVKTANLPSGSNLYVYNKSAGAYIKYTRKSDGSGWQLVQDKTYVVGATGTMVEGAGVTSDNLHVARGEAVFVETPAAPANDAKCYVAGVLPSTNTVITITEGANLVGVPKAAGFDLNAGPGSVTFTTIANSTITGGRLAAAGDVIQVATDDVGNFVRYYYNGTSWGKFVLEGDNEFTQTSSFVTTGCVIPAGQGFWYIRKSGTGSMTISW